MNNLLEKSSNTLRDKRTVKFSLDCSDTSPDTRKWLKVIKKISESPDSGILEGSLNKISKKIVVKFQESKASKLEYEVSSILFDTSIPNFIKYYCSFSCNDDVKKFINMKSPEYICKESAGVNIGYIVMPLYSEGSVADYRWTTDNFKVFKSVIKQSVIALATAFIHTGFVHEDFHVGNILMRKTKKTKLNYNLGISASTDGMYAIIMDFQRSSFSYNVIAFKKSLRKLFGCLRSIGQNSVIVLDNLDLINSLSTFEEVSKESILKITSRINKMKIVYSFS